MQKITPKVNSFLIQKLYYQSYIFLKITGNKKQNKSKTSEKQPIKSDEDNDQHSTMTVRICKNL